jgi:hypothetical protein
MKWSGRNKNAPQRGAIITGALAAAGLMLLSSVAGLHAATTGLPAPADTVQPASPADTAAGNQVTGILQKINRSTLTVLTRNGASVLIDDTQAAQARTTGVLVIGKAYTFRGTYDPRGKLLAAIIWRAKPSTEAWPKDR